MSRSAAWLLLLAACSTETADSPDGGVSPEPDAPIDAMPPPLEERCISRVPDREWGGNADESARVTISKTGGVFVHGYENGNLADTKEPGVDARGFVERWSGNDIRWSHNSGAAIDLVATDAWDRMTFVGRARSGSQLDILVGEMSPHGMELRTSTIGGPASERPYSLLVNGDQRTVVGHDDIYIPSNYVASWEDSFVFRWSRTEGPERGTFLRAASPSPDTTTGGALGLDNESTVIVGSTVDGAFVRHVDAAFREPAWAQYGIQETVRSIHKLPDGDYLIAGSTGYELGTRSFGGQDVFIARLDPQLRIRWLEQHGSEAGDFALDLAVDDTTGRAYLLGETTGDVAGAPAGQTDFFVIALDESGHQRWAAQRGSAGDDRATTIAVDACENVLVAGATTGHLVPDHEPRGYDAFVVSITPTE